MNPNAPQGIARAVMTDADQLSRLAHRDGDDALAARFAAVRTELSSIERRCGASPQRQVTNVEIDRAQEHIRFVVRAARGREPDALLDRLTSLAERLRPPRARTLIGVVP
jgi:hypothetical protein